MRANIHPTVLLILDGWGCREASEYNAIAQARTPIWDQMLKDCPHTRLVAHGAQLGLPEYQMGNSEVGHLHIGAGRLVPQGLARINQSIEKNELPFIPQLKNHFERAAELGSSVHLFGLLSAGGVHGHVDHFKALIRLAAELGVKRCFVHAFLDGRDTPPRSALPWLKAIDADAKNFSGVCRIASICGRFYGMDRDQRWERTIEAYQLIVNGAANFSAPNTETALQMAYDRGECDEFVQPTLILSGKAASARLKPEDVLVSVNFRADRTRQLCRLLTEEAPEHLTTLKIPAGTSLITMTEYPAVSADAVIFPAITLNKTLGEVVSERGLSQLRIAETEKYAHVTFFMNGGIEPPFPGEERILIQSPKVKTYDMKPEMSLPVLTERLCESIRSKSKSLIICNIANADMVGHTGQFEAAIKAVEAIDTALEKIQQACQETDTQLLITADHGNIEWMYDVQTQQPHTAHTCEAVPLLYAGSRKATFARTGSLIDIAPTVLACMGCEQPNEMDGQSLIDWSKSISTRS